MKFVGRDGQFDVEAFRHAVDTMILAQEIIVDNASYPTEKIGQNSHAFRPLGLGFANLGALLMSMGVPYDSDQGRDHAGAITAIMCGQAYLTSSRIADAVGTFAGYEVNQQPFLEVIRIDSTGTIEGAPELKPEHLAVFDCSFRPQNGTRSIHYMGHVKMMAAVQPFISGAISKTINMPEECSVEDIMTAYTESWKLGWKAVAIYRDNSQRGPPPSPEPGKGHNQNAAPRATAAAASAGPR